MGIDEEKNVSLSAEGLYELDASCAVSSGEILWNDI